MKPRPQPAVGGLQPVLGGGQPLGEPAVGLEGVGQFAGEPLGDLGHLRGHHTPPVR